MADVSRNSDVIANLVATPRVKNQPIKSGTVHNAIAKHTYVSGDSAPSLATVLRVPAHARIKSLKISSLDFTTAGAINIGLHTESSPGVASTAVDADLFASAVDLAGGPYNQLDVMNEGAFITPAERVLALWEMAGVSAEPAAGTHYLITATITTTIDSTNLDVVYEVEYIL